MFVEPLCESLSQYRYAHISQQDEDTLSQREMVDKYEDLCNGCSSEYMKLDADVVHWLKVGALREGIGLGRYISKTILEAAQIVIEEAKIQKEAVPKKKRATNKKKREKK